MNDELLLKARELLAVEYERSWQSATRDPERIRKGRYDTTPDIRAILSALKSAQPVEGGKGEPVGLRDFLSAKMHHLPVEDQHVLSVILDANPQPAAQQPAGDGGVDALRPAFERWVANRHGSPVDRWADSGKYKYDNTNSWWECWHEAIAALRANAEKSK